MRIWQCSQPTQSCGVTRGTIWPILSWCHLLCAGLTQLLQSSITSSMRQVSGRGCQGGTTGCAVPAVVPWGKQKAALLGSASFFPRTAGGPQLPLWCFYFRVAPEAEEKLRNSLSLAVQEPGLSWVLQVREESSTSHGWGNDPRSPEPDTNTLTHSR